MSRIPGPQHSRPIAHRTEATTHTRSCAL